MTTKINTFTDFIDCAQYLVGTFCVAGVDLFGVIGRRGGGGDGGGGSSGGDGNDGGGGCDDDGHCSKYTGWLGVWLVAHHALTPDGFMDGWIHGWMSPVCCHVWLAAPHQTQT